MALYFICISLYISQPDSTKKHFTIKSLLAFLALSKILQCAPNSPKVSWSSDLAMGICRDLPEVPQNTTHPEREMVQSMFKYKAQDKRR